MFNNANWLPGREAGGNAPRNCPAGIDKNAKTAIKHPLVCAQQASPNRATTPPNSWPRAPRALAKAMVLGLMRRVANTVSTTKSCHALRVQR